MHNRKNINVFIFEVWEIYKLLDIDKSIFLDFYMNIVYHEAIISVNTIGKID